MASWEAVAGGPLFREVFSPLEDIADGLSSILSPIQTILGILRSILKIIRVFLLDVTSIVMALIKTLVKQITDFIRNLGNSGIFFLTVAPDFGSLGDMLNSTRGGIDAFVDKVVGSLEDSLDPYRPNFPSSQKVGGVALAVSTGNLMNAINFLGLFFTAIKQTFNQLYPPPAITGASGNSANIIQFERPALPGAFFTGVKFTLERGSQPGGAEATTTTPLATTNPTKNVSLQAPDIDPQTNQTRMVWTAIDSVTYTNSFTSPERIIFIDQNSAAEGKAPHLIRFDLSNQADTKNFQVSLTSVTSLGPTTFRVFTTEIAGEPLLNPTFATKEEIDGILPSSSQSDIVKSKYVQTASKKTVYLDFRVNGLSVPLSAPTEGGISVSASSLYVTSVTENEVTLSQPVPVGSRVEAYTYIMASSGDILKRREFNAGHPSLYTDIRTHVNTGSNQLVNGTPYYYRIRVHTLVPDPTKPNSESTSGGVSNEIRLIPRQAYAPTPSPAFCMSTKQGPFVIVPGQNILSFRIGSKYFKVSLPISKLNVFASNYEDFNNSFGLYISPAFDNQTNPSVVDTAVLLTDRLERVASGRRGLTFYYSDGVGRKQLVSPGQYIPVDVDDVISEIQAQVNDPSVLVRSFEGRIMIQDNSFSNYGSSVEFLLDCKSLGFDKGVCMNVIKPSPPNWSRLAIKDFIPQINQAADIIDAFVNGILSSAESPIKALVDFIDLLDAKIKSMEAFIQRLQDLLNLLNSLKVQLPNIYKLEIPICNGTDQLKNEIENATRPLSSADDFAVGVVLIAGGFGAEATVTLLHQIL
jgi:hypothetical protein